ncbi:MAG: MBL fold metallo-hydrolase [Calditrichae bacterium]|nr:MBL fold metallo-hydrolase [Calditrichia bacterium]
MHDKSHHTRTGFRNTGSDFEERGLKDVLKWMVWDRFIKNERSDEADTVTFELAENDPHWLAANKTELSVTWVGHSTLLIQIDGMNILSDPVWAERASPVSFAGPGRLVKPGIDFDKLPKIDMVIISHDHYDHLDKETIEMLGNDPYYLVPLGLGEFLEDLDITNYQELDWWDEIKFNNIRFVCVPAQHFSGRTLFDRNQTLWCGWVMQGARDKIYYAGDTGYFSEFKNIGRKLGPFTIAAIPIGAYQPQWFMSPVHISPQEAVDVYLDVKAKYFIPIHWGTFQLSDEPISEPPRLLLREVNNRKLDADLFRVLKHGETFVLPAQVANKNRKKIVN